MSEPQEKPLNTVLGFRKLPARYAAIVLPFFLTLFMTCVVSLIATLRGVGLADGMVRLWLGSWALSWIVAFPVLVLILPSVRRMTGLIVDMRG